MTKEDKLLLLKDLCMRLPYGVTIRYNIDLVMTKEEEKELKKKRKEVINECK